MQNCEADHVAASARLIGETTCRGLLCGEPITYAWTLLQRMQENVWPQWQAVRNLEEFLLTYRNSPNVVIRENKLRDNVTYRLEVVGETERGFRAVAEYEFTTNSPPYGGQCAVDTSEGEHDPRSFKI